MKEMIMISHGLQKFQGMTALDFLKTHAVVPCDHIQVHKVTQDMGDDHLTLNAQARIAFFDIVKEKSKGVPEEGAYKVVTKALTEVVPQDRGNYASCYYLPWTGAGGIVETILRPPPAVQRGRSGPVVASRPPGRFQLGAQRDRTREDARVSPSAGLDPDIFFTTQLSGCSVFITGSAQEPTVYHAGAGRTVNADPTKYWHDLFTAVLAKGGGTLQPFVEINKNHYNFKQRANVGTVHETARTNPNLTEYAQILIADERRAGRPFHLHVVSGWGNVFGLRDATSRNWAFYKQEVVHIVYTRVPDVNFMHPSIQAVSRVAAITQVYPSESALLTPRLCCKPLKS